MEATSSESGPAEPPSPRTREVGWVRRAGGAVLLLILTAVALVIVSPGLAEKLTFFPARSDPGSAPTFPGVEGRDVTLEAEDGVRIHAWWFPVGGGGPSLILFHGNAGNIAGRTPMARELTARGISVLLPDYRGFGRSEGSPSEAGLYADGRAALAFVAAESGGPERVVVMGRSIGGAVASRIALEASVAGVILEAAFTSLDRMAAAAYPFLPSFLFRRLRGRYDNLTRVGRLDMPVLVVHGTRDELVPPEMGRALHEAAGTTARWLPVEGAGHNDVSLVGGGAYFDELADFVREVTGSASSASETEGSGGGS